MKAGAEQYQLWDAFLTEWPIERLRNIDPDVNAIICSGYSDEAALSEFLSYGFRGALPKPFTRRELAAALQKALDGAKVN